jgi:hypothetical protein
MSLQKGVSSPMSEPLPVPFFNLYDVPPTDIGGDYATGIE